MRAKAKPGTKRAKRLPPFDRYFHYTNSVQGAAHDAALMARMFAAVWRGPPPKTIVMQEDFCATAELCYEWVALGPHMKAVGIDLDADSLAWGEKHHGVEMSPDVTSRVRLIHGDVLVDHGVRPHMISAFNFSYSFIHSRDLLKQYLTACYDGLTPGGMLILDCFGGADYIAEPHSNKRRNVEHKFNFWWNVHSFDALSHRIFCSIDYQRDGEKRRNKVFTYDWRLWTPPELTDALKEVGFSHVEYWSEGLDRSGAGNGKFQPVTKEVGCSTWICYIIARR